MFKDYYLILEIGPESTPAEIKAAFKQQAIKWHPDRNPGQDTTSKMQEINEAYLILKDIQARARYDVEYEKYTKYRSVNKERYEQTYEATRETASEKREEATSEEYIFDDEILKRWMANARRQAVDLAKQTIKEVGQLSVTATKAAGSKMLEWTMGYIVGGFILMILFKACGG